MCTNCKSRVIFNKFVDFYLLIISSSETDCDFMIPSQDSSITFETLHTLTFSLSFFFFFFKIFQSFKIIQHMNALLNIACVLIENVQSAFENTTTFSEKSV